MRIRSIKQGPLFWWLKCLSPWTPFECILSSLAHAGSGCRPWMEAACIEYRMKLKQLSIVPNHAVSVIFLFLLLFVIWWREDELATTQIVTFFLEYFVNYTFRWKSTKSYVLCGVRQFYYPVIQGQATKINHPIKRKECVSYFVLAQASNLNLYIGALRQTALLTQVVFSYVIPKLVFS